jgi:hypothetical protein
MRGRDAGRFDRQRALGNEIVGQKQRDDGVTLAEFRKGLEGGPGPGTLSDAISRESVVARRLVLRRGPSYW